jgi:enamine deaminase RidA (YjgF/YER057c/UK114 family)
VDGGVRPVQKDAPRHSPRTGQDAGPAGPIEERSRIMTVTRIGVGPRMSEAVIHNGTVYVAGQVGKPGADVRTQAKQALAEVDRILAAAGTDKTKILQTIVWLADIGDFAAMNEVWDAWVAPGHTPARATGEAKLATPDYKVEFIVTAALP